MATLSQSKRFVQTLECCEVGVSFDDELFPKVISKLEFNGQAEGSGPTWGGWGPKRLKKKRPGGSKQEGHPRHHKT
eukprot:scaffold2317_cov209-Chaetoceros_neogracile.AAC.2